MQMEAKDNSIKELQNKHIMRLPQNFITNFRIKLAAEITTLIAYDVHDPEKVHHHSITKKCLL